MKAIEKIEKLTEGLKSFQQRAAHQLYAFNRWEKRDEILSKIEAGEHVIIENYAFDSITDLIASGEKIENCLYCDKGLPRPDIVFQLDADIELVKQRKSLPKTTEFYFKKREAYKEFREKMYWKVINVNRDANEVFRSVVFELNLLIKEYKENSKVDESRKNYYPTTVGEDMFLENSI